MLIIKNTILTVILVSLSWFAITSPSPWYSSQVSATVTDIIWNNGSANISYCTELQYCDSVHLSKINVDTNEIVVGSTIDVMVLNMYADGMLWTVMTLLSKLIVITAIYLLGFYYINTILRETFGSDPD